MTSYPPDTQSSDAPSLLPLYFAVMTMGMGLAGPGIGVTATFTVDANEQGGLAGLLASFAGLGFVLGPLLGGYVYRFDMTYPSWAAAILVLPVIVLTWRMKSQEPSSIRGFSLS